MKTTNLTLLKPQISHYKNLYENFKSHTMKTTNLALWKPQISHYKNLKSHIMKISNLTLWKPQISHYENLKSHIIKTSNLTMKTWDLTLWKPQISYYENLKSHTASASQNLVSKCCLEKEPLCIVTVTRNLRVLRGHDAQFLWHTMWHIITIVSERAKEILISQLWLLTIVTRWFH